MITVHSSKLAPDFITLSNFKVLLWLILYFQINISYIAVMLEVSLIPEILLDILDIITK